METTTTTRTTTLLPTSTPTFDTPPNLPSFGWAVFSPFDETDIAYFVSEKDALQWARESEEVVELFTPVSAGQWRLSECRGAGGREPRKWAEVVGVW